MADQHELLFATADKLGDCRMLGFRHRIGQQPVRLLSAFACPKVVRAFKADRVNLGERDELAQFNAVAGFRLQALQFGFGKADLLVFGELIAAHEIVTLNGHVAHGAVVAVSDA